MTSGVVRGWVRLDTCQRSLFTQDSSKRACERAHCIREGKCKYQAGVGITHACTVHQLHMDCTKSNKYTYIFQHTDKENKDVRDFEMWLNLHG